MIGDWPGIRDDPHDPMLPSFERGEELQDAASIPVRRLRREPAEPDPPPSSRPFVVSGVVLAVAIGLWLLAWW